MGSKRAADPIADLVEAYSGSTDVTAPRRWNRAVHARQFNKGDLVTLAPEFRYSIAISRPDFGRYVGIVTEAYANREYMVVWTNQPLTHGSKKGLFNGDHLLLVENAERALMGSK